MARPSTQRRSRRKDQARCDDEAPVAALATSGDVIAVASRVVCTADVGEAYGPAETGTTRAATQFGMLLPWHRRQVAGFVMFRSVWGKRQLVV